MKNTWRFTDKELEKVKEVLGSGFSSASSGSMNKQFEEAFAQKVGVDYAIALNSGTATLQAALDAVGVGYGDEVITTPLTVISNAYVILQQNAVPVFADIDPNTFNIDPEDVARKITPKTKAIMPVSLYGLPCDLEPLMLLAKKHGIYVINDAAQAHLAMYKNKPIATHAHISSYSTESTKHITTGDGGIVVTDNENFAVKMRKFGALGYAALTSGDGRVRLNKELFQNPDYKRHDSFGYNYRLPEVAAALGLAQTQRIEHFIQLRCDVAKMYDEVIQDCDYLVSQHNPSGYKNTYWSYAVKYERTDVSWQDFRRKYVELGGDGIYAAWALSYEETLFSSGEFKKRCPPIYSDLSFPRGICPVAEQIQPKIMQFVNNYSGVDEASSKVEALRKTIHYFGK